MIASAKHDYNSSKIQENSGNARILFKTVEKLLNSNPAQRYPIGHDNLSESFVEFFTDKTGRIRNDLDSYSVILNESPLTLCSAEPEPCLASQLLSEFRPVNEDVISDYMYINNLCNKSCSLDPIPSSVFQRCRHELVPVITRIVNLSLQSGQVPDRFKAAVIKPLLKKSGANHENFSNFRPLSNLYLLSNVTEKAVAAQ